jgi:hypothetical protein
MSYKFISILILGLIVSISKLSCSPQTANKDEEVVVKDTKEIDEKGGTVAIEGTEVTVPPGALAAGSQVAVEKTDTPGEFSSNASEAASYAVNISAKDKDGKAIDSVTTPMTIGIDYGDSASLALLGAAEDLCVLLKAKAGLFVWRRGSLKVASSKVEISTLNFGIFQVVYCGTETLDGFKEATKAQTGEAGNNVTMIIPSDGNDFGNDKYCYAVMRAENGSDDEDEEGNFSASIIASGEADVDRGSDQSLTLEVAPGDVHSDKEHYFFISYDTSTADCAFQLGDQMDNDFAFNNSIFMAFKVESSDMSAGFEATLYESGIFDTTSHTISVGRGDGGNMASFHKEKKVCVIFDSDNGRSHFPTAITSNGIGSDNSLLIFEPAGNTSGEHKEINVVLGSDCTSLDDRPKSAAETGHPYAINFENDTISDGGTYYITPIDFSIAFAEGVACMRIYKNGALASGDLNESIGETLLQIDGILSPRAYDIYLPFIEGALYDIRLTLMEKGKTCSDSNSATLPPQDIKGKPLAASISIP